MRWPAPTSLAAIVSVAALLGASRPADIAFRVQMIDPGYGETVTVADVNRDGKLDIVSGESWYEAPGWTKHPLRSINYANGYIDNFADLAMDVDGDGWTDIIQFSYFAHNIVWLKNPGKAGGEWKASEIDNSGPTEFAFLVDLDNDGRANELLPEFDRPNAPAAWFEHRDGKWIKHVVAPQSYGHGIGVGDMNGDGRNDILTPKGWLEAPMDVRAEGFWKFHPMDWGWKYIPPSGTPADEVKPSAAAQRAGAQFGYMYLLDINGDGRKDMVTGMAHDYGLAWYEQTADGHFVQHVIDSSWSQAHASQLVDMNGDGQPDLVIGKRYFAHNGGDPGEREPVGIYWYEWRKVSPATAQNGGVEWVRHIVDYGGRMGGGVQTVAVDIDGDGDIDLISANKSGLFLAENLTKSSTKNTRR
ncbi:FG-GAP repeat domain-containing protein [Terriglobus roseus]|uniref:Repeat domain-containing protein n=1 Tax=Terriglobus roseus TaxID=392734 RepID=A0A1G7J1Y7_9BACT|nr:VCBS repeat-containing protein [Terriglobus roseus]SDF18901.1 Repeat domain-containing protein [Terriglobus roseus]